MHDNPIVLEGKACKKTLGCEPANIGAAGFDGGHAHIASIEEEKLHGIVSGTLEVCLEPEQPLTFWMWLRAPPRSDDQGWIVRLVDDFRAASPSLVQQNPVEFVPA